MKMKKFVLGMILLSSFTVFARNRILEAPEISDNFRCKRTGINQQKCSVMQEKALKSNCINLEEYRTLKERNEAPYCDEEADLISWCSCGCFDPDTRIFVEGLESGEKDWRPISDIVKDIHSYWTWSLAEEFQFSNLVYKKNKIEKFTSGPEVNPLVYIHTEAGNKLGITGDHAVLLASGEMVPANSLKVGDRLVNTEGSFIKIETIEHKVLNKDVLNILVNDKNHKGHIIFAEGLLVGDLAWQNSLEGELNAVLIRQS